MIFRWTDIDYYFGAAFLPFTLPALIIGFLGWRLGRVVAMRSVTFGQVGLLSAGITLIPVISWANSISLMEQMAGEPTGFPVVGGMVVVGWGLALFFAAISWAMNLDSFWDRRRARKGVDTLREGPE